MRAIRRERKREGREGGREREREREEKDMRYEDETSLNCLLQKDV